jgi:HK97 family phage major capsid protein
MSIEEQVKTLIAEVTTTRTEILKGDEVRKETIAQLQKDVATHSKSTGDTVAKLERVVTDQAAWVTKQQSLEAAIESLSKKVNRPGGSGSDDKDGEAVRKSAIGWLEQRHLLRVPKMDPLHPFAATEAEIEEAIGATKAMRALLHSVDIAHLPEFQRKALTAFQMGASGFILQPEMSARILSCLIDISDVTGLMSNITISGPSIKFMVDEVRLMQAAWACESTCFANNPQANLTDGLGEVEFKPETLRYIVCSSRDILEDASVDVESWMLAKVNWAFRNTVSTAILTGDGIGKPLGILNPAAGIPICDTSASSPAGQFTWQDLIMLKWQVPVQWHGGGGGRYLMNQYTFGLVLTMADALSRPIMISMPTDSGQFIINGSPVQVVTQMPDVAPGATPVAFGNWPAVYMIVNRKAVTMQQDPFSAGFCVLWKFESRIGGGVICPGAARLLRIR